MVAVEYEYRQLAVQIYLEHGVVVGYRPVAPIEYHECNWQQYETVQHAVKHSRVGIAIENELDGIAENVQNIE